MEIESPKANTEQALQPNSEQMQKRNSQPKTISE